MTDVSDLIGEELPQRLLAPRESLFVDEYMVDFCQWKALMRADGSDDPKAKAWRVLSSEVMRRPHVKAEVQRRVALLSERIDARAEDVRREIARMALFDPAHITGVAGPDDIAQLPEDTRRAIVGWSWDKHGNFVVKMAKEGALEMLGRHFGLFEKDKPTVGVQVVIHATPHDEKL